MAQKIPTLGYGPGGSIGFIVRLGYGASAAVAGLTLEESLVAALRADAAVSALVGTRIHPDGIPQKSTVPALVYEVTNDAPVRVLSGRAGPRDFGVSIWCVADARSAAKRLAEAVHALLDERQGRLGGSGGVIVHRFHLNGWDNEEWDRGDGADRPWRVVALGYEGRYVDGA